MPISDVNCSPLAGVGTALQAEPSQCLMVPPFTTQTLVSDRPAIAEPLTDDDSSVHLEPFQCSTPLPTAQMSSADRAAIACRLWYPVGTPGMTLQSCPFQCSISWRVR